MLQANATIIAGILILLTVLGSVAKDLVPSIKILFASAITPFIVSIILLLVETAKKQKFSEKTKLQFAKMITIAGLCYLILDIIYVLFATG